MKIHKCEEECINGHFTGASSDDRSLPALPGWMIKHEHKCILDPKYAPYNCLMNGAMQIAWEALGDLKAKGDKHGGEIGIAGDLSAIAMRRIEKLGEE